MMGEVPRHVPLNPSPIVQDERREGVGGRDGVYRRAHLPNDCWLLILLRGLVFCLLFLVLITFPRISNPLIPS
jgi:hypothetical protein